MKPYLIGLTGNIASGKSVIRQYLENAGALTIDADLIAQDTYLPGQPAWQPILDRFGEDLRGLDGQINRNRLGRIVFNDPQALADLEAIVHPFVWERLDELFEQARSPIVVVEAIRLVNSQFAELCNEIWVATSAADVRIQRLMETRGLSEQEARARVEIQEPEAEKVKHATRVIATDGSFRQLYEQVHDHLITIEQENNIHLIQKTGWRTVNPSQFVTFLGPLSLAISNIETDEDLYRLLSTSNLISNGELLVLFDNLHFLTLLHRVIPQKTTLGEKKDVVCALEQFAEMQMCNAVIVKQLWLTPKEAKTLAFEPGDFSPPGAQGFIYRDVLRRQGLMPGEVYRKPL